MYAYEDYIYSGSKSLYTPAARPSNLHRSQSVCTRPLPPNPNPDLPAPPPTQKGLLHNNLMVYNAQQLEQQKHQQQLLQQQHHFANNINKPTPDSSTLSQYAKNIRNVSSPSESEYSAASTVTHRIPHKSNLIKPEPIYKTQTSTSNNHNNKTLLLQQQQQQYQPQIQMQQQYSTNNGHAAAYQNAPITSSRSSTQTDRSASVMSSATNPHSVRYNPGEDDDASQYGERNVNYRIYGNNRPELPTPGSVHSDISAANSAQRFHHYRNPVSKQY